MIGVAIALAGSGTAWAAPFTGPTGVYYLDNYTAQRIYEVQGTGVIASFPWAYGSSGSGGCASARFCEGSLAVANGAIATDWFGNYAGSPGSAGQYTLSGTPTGVSWNDTSPPAGETQDQFYDGTSNGTENFTAEYSNSKSTQNVIATDLDWQNPKVLFQVVGSVAGIAYDAYNDSLWIDTYLTGTITDYSLSGQVLSSFSTANKYPTALAFDPADQTLWVSDNVSFQLTQLSTTGQALQGGTPSGLPTGAYFSGEFAEGPLPARVPEPGSLWLFGSAAVALRLIARRQRIR